MTNSTTLTVSNEIFARLQALAIPLVDNPNSIIERLISHWESHPPVSSATVAAIESWHSSRGDVLRVGTKLQASFRKEIFYATVEKEGIRFDGVLYSSLSSAGQAVKKNNGATDTAAITNGRHFWQLQHHISGNWISVKELSRN